MACWKKKSEDPWDVEPEKTARPAETGEKEDAPSLLDELRDWNEDRKEKKRQREAPPPPMACPWCGQEMEVGWIPDQGVISWWAGVPTAMDKWLGGGLREESHMTLEMKGGLFGRYLTAWHCDKCRRLVLDTSECCMEKELPSEEVDRRILYGAEAERTNNEGENDT